MPSFVQYTLEDGSTILVESEEVEGGLVGVSQDGNVILEAGQKFTQALRSAKQSAIALVNEFRDLPIEEMEVTFGLKTSGEAGIFAIGKVGAESNFQVKLKWRRPAG